METNLLGLLLLLLTDADFGMLFLKFLERLVIMPSDSVAEVRIDIGILR